MLSAALQVLAFALAVVGVLGAAVATLLPNWKVSAWGWAGPAAPAWRMQGLWLDCVCYPAALFSCTPKAPPLALPAALHATRAAMLLSCVLGLLGLSLAALGLKCTRWGGGRRAKGHTAVAGGACLVLAGVLSLLPASWFAQRLLADFGGADPADGGRFQPGGALGLTFVSAGFLLAGGVILCMSCPGGRGSQPSPGPPSAGPRREERTRPGRNGSAPPAPPKAVKDSYVLQEYV